jgi:hypothetical protein
MLGRNTGSDATDKLRVANALISRFWGLSTDGTGNNITYERLGDELRELKLSGKQFKRLRLELPEPEIQNSPVAARVRRCSNLLTILEESL